MLRFAENLSLVPQLAVCRTVFATKLIYDIQQNKCQIFIKQEITVEINVENVKPDVIYTPLSPMTASPAESFLPDSFTAIVPELPCKPVHA